LKWWINDSNSSNNIFNLGLKEADHLREPHWPIEMQVIKDKIHHIDTVFQDTEPFYIKSKKHQFY
jgi:hypothetical protein